MAAFGALYEQHGPAVLRYLTRRLGAQVGEDAAHDVFLRAFRLLGTYDPTRGSEVGWLFGIAVKVVSEHRRADGRRLRAIERLALALPVCDDADPGLVLSPNIVRALRRLPAKERESLLLVVWGELSYDETAAALGIPVGTVRSRISRARSSLQGAAGEHRRVTAAVQNGDPRV